MSMMNGGPPTMQERAQVADMLRTLASKIEAKDLYTLHIEMTRDVQPLYAGTAYPTGATVNGEGFSVKFTHAPELIGG